ncbi:hypothetical protein R5W24_001150 [Gemmata sp. JC717]|uniref:hypothetical protein n=1 Tax=Gemmata algarum TaxID=2975278 RepID=UPI0021BBA511|nr:hypothetical protein [Gemmata algarum]MDY3552070.1 hypothetical protein [Gemmata algarum]
MPKRRRALERWLKPALHAPLGNRTRAARAAIDDHRIGHLGKLNRDTTRPKDAGGTHNVHTDRLLHV